MRKLQIVGLLLLAGLLTKSTAATAQANETFKRQCSSCHGIDGSASTPAGKRLRAADLRSKAVQDLSDEEIYKTIAYGVGHKNYPHAFVKRGFTEKEVADLVVLIRKLAH
ncbi:MAG: cytochrome c [Acidobacteriaceae bacterium]|nr:cytochrome c [Acidobacteriaceae bacterium]